MVPLCQVFPSTSLTVLHWFPFGVLLPLSISSRLWLFEDLSWPSLVLLWKAFSAWNASQDSWFLHMLFPLPETFFLLFLE